jgi:meromycolic acid enoyl-[acyl-carrier-protein] reductase
MRLDGRCYLVTGVLTVDSIAWHVAQGLQHAGAQILLTSHGRARKQTARAVRALPEPCDVLELDVTRDEDFPALAAELERRWGRVDGIVHSIAGAPPDAINGGFLTTSAASAGQAFQISAYSMQALTAVLLPLLQRSEHNASVVGIDFDATLAWAAYDWMGVVKAALESVNRYLALYLGPLGIRSNLVAAGPIETVSGVGLDDMLDLVGHWQRTAPVGWDPTSAQAVVGPVLFLLSDMAAAVTGEIIHADGGFHVVGLRLPDGIESRKGTDE